MEAKVKKTGELFLRKINIKNWTSPVAKQYKIEAIPHFKIYDPRGKLIKEGFKVYREILKWKSKKVTKIKKISIISKGEKVDIKKYLVKGKTTIFEFYADW